MRAGHLGGWTALVAALLVAAGALLPVPPQFLTNHLDPSFGVTLHFAAAHGYRVGSGLISPFGPLGFVFYHQYSPDTFAALFAVRAVLAALTCWALAWIGSATWGLPWGAALALFACVPFLAPPDVWFMTLPLLALLIELPAGRNPPASLRAALGVGIGAVGMIKFTFLVAALAVLVPMAAVDLLARRRVPLTAATALITAMLVWVATGHTAADWLRYLDWSVWEITAGYATAMHFLIDGRLILHAVVVSLLVFVVTALLIEQRLHVGRRAAQLALGIVLALLFKAGFVRADVHVFITCFALLVIAALLALLWSRRPSQLFVGALLVALVPGGLLAHAVAVVGWPSTYFRPVLPPRAIRRLAALPFVVAGDALTRAADEHAAAIRAANPLPALQGSVDVYSYDQAVVLAHGFDFHPRPAFQSYMAYTPRLAHANAQFLLDDGAPEWILFHVESIDMRLASLEDAPSWPLLITQYGLFARAWPFAVLQRRATPLAWHLEPLGNVQTQTGELINVPSGAEGPIWARINVHETRRDALVAALLTGPVMYVGIGRVDGRARAYRIVTAMARDGFLLSPVVEDTADFTRLFTPETADRGHDASSLTVQFKAAPGISTEPRQVEIEFFRLVVER